MSASQRVSRGVHRLAVLLATVPFIVGVVLSFHFASGSANHAKISHDEQVRLVCAKSRIAPPPSKSDIDVPYDLKALGCSDQPQDATYDEISAAKPPGDFSYAANFLPDLSVRLAITLAVSLLVYGVVRAIGWVIGGFTTS